MHDHACDDVICKPLIRTEKGNPDVTPDRRECTKFYFRSPLGQTKRGFSQDSDDLPNKKIQQSHSDTYVELNKDKFNLKHHPHPPLYFSPPLVNRISRAGETSISPVRSLLRRKRSKSLDEVTQNITNGKHTQDNQGAKTSLHQSSHQGRKIKSSTGVEFGGVNILGSNNGESPGSEESWRNNFLLSGISRHQIPSNIFRPETYSEYDFTLHDPESEMVLEILFPSNSNTTFGLPRSVTPFEDYEKRYWHLVLNAISTEMVAPISEDLIKGTHRKIPRQLLLNFKAILAELDQVSFTVRLKFITVFNSEITLCMETAGSYFVIALVPSLFFGGKPDEMCILLLLQNGCNLSQFALQDEILQLKHKHRLLRVWQFHV